MLLGALYKSLVAPRQTGLTMKPQGQFGLVLLLAALCAALVLGFSVGAVPFSLLSLLTGTASTLETTVFYDIRGPRVVLATFVGASLAVSGACLQGLFRNPLADPGLIGVSSGGALGAIFIIVFGASLGLADWVMPYALPVSAVMGAVLVTLFLYTFASYFGQFSVVTILLVGIAVNALAGVGIGAFQYLADDGQLRSMVFWMMGSLGRATWLTLLPAVFLMSICMLMLIRQSKNLDLLQLGEHEAEFLGTDVTRLKRNVILASAAGVGAGVSLCGIIGFIGLVVPHLVRLSLGPSHKSLIPGSALLGAVLMILADLVARTTITPAEIPVSLVTSALGAPFFLWLISRSRPV